MNKNTRKLIETWKKNVVKTIQKILVHYQQVRQGKILEILWIISETIFHNWKINCEAREHLSAKTDRETCHWERDPFSTSDYLWQVSKIKKFPVTKGWFFFSLPLSFKKVGKILDFDSDRALKRTNLVKNQNLSRVHFQRHQAAHPCWPVGCHGQSPRASKCIYHTLF